ncbi:MAG: glycerol-3-phosphate 1-O-acyltransferase PlsY [Proteobacteria bacterium]|nr:glycerol-3-phosphate 1-O-acyltransferase PlsY [Pseudomonadota bacterium]
MDIIIDIVFVIFSYLLGSVPTGVIISRYFFNVDIQKVGSGNIGATNVARTLGKKVGILTLIGDALKGVIPIILVRLYEPYPLNQPLIFFCALGAFLGHLFPIYLKFKGGKGVATALGIFLMLFPFQTMLSAIVFFIIVYFSRYVSLGSISASIVMPILVSFRAQNTYQIALSIIISLLIIIKHKDNIHRLLEGRENKLKL